MVKVLEVFIRKGVWISGDIHSGTNNVKIKIHKYFSLTVNIVTKKSKKMGVRLFFWSATRMLWGESIVKLSASVRALQGRVISPQMTQIFADSN